MNPTSPEDLDQAARLILGAAPAGALPANNVAALAAPTNLAIREATGALIAAERFDLVEQLYAMFWDRSDLGPWARFNMARRWEQIGEYARAIEVIVEAIPVFPKRAVPHWWVWQARCERALGKTVEAEATLRRAATRFPEDTLVVATLADLIAKENRPAEAAAAWRGLIDGFPSGREIHWYTGLAAAFRAMGRLDEAHAALEEMASALPEEPRALALLAVSVGERHDWERALELWTLCGERHLAMAREAANGRARALFRLWRIEPAFAAWRELTAREPHFALAFRDMGTAARELGDFVSATECFQTLVDRFPEALKPEWLASLARCWNDRREYAAGESVLRDLERRFPESTLAAEERLRIAEDREEGQAELAARVEAALARFPDEPAFLAARVLILLGYRHWEEGEAIVARLEAEERGVHALISRLRLTLDVGGEDAVRRGVLGRAASRAWTLDDAPAIGEFLLRLWSPWANDLASAILAEVARLAPRQARLVGLRARVEIARRRDDLALALIDSLPPEYQRGETLELRAWAAARRGADGEAKRLWKQNLATRYFAAAHCPIVGLELKSSSIATEGVSAYVVFRDEAPAISGFLAHHRALGVRRFVFIDHASRDDSAARLLREPDVELYRCDDSYQLSWSGRRWVNELASRDGVGWALQLDVDERFVYPGCESVSIDRLTAYLDSAGHEAVRAFMLDVFPTWLLDAAGEPTSEREYRHYDGDYAWLGQMRPPYLHPTGGARARLFAAKEFLHKVPLWRADRGLLINSHETTHLRFAEVTGALLHFKLLNVARRGRAARSGREFLEADSGTDAMRRHSRYAARLKALWRADLRAPGVTEELAGSLALVDRGLIQAPTTWTEWRGRDPDQT
jgi:tetratricopeptide (TPR) repeat protein